MSNLNSSDELMELLSQPSESVLRQTPSGMEVKGNLAVRDDISTTGSVFCSRLNPIGHDYAEYFERAKLNDAITAH